MRTVITYGTFDLFHKGHYNILKRAKEEGDYLIVGVTGETYDAERGKLSVQDSLATRIENVKKTGFADKVIVEEYLGQKIPDILKYHVDVLVIGSDWKGKFDHLSKYCEIKYLERTKDISSTQLREENLDILKFGIVTDDMYDNDAVIEPKIVSGIHVESVFAPEQSLADEFKEKYELAAGHSDYASFLDGVDIAYIKMPRDKRLEYVKQAVEAGKHVICDMPFTMDREEEGRIRRLAEEKNVALMENITTLYLAAFGQLLWMARGNLIGDLVSIKATISKNMFDERSGYDFTDLAYYPTCVITKILGTERQKVHSKLVKGEDGSIRYGLIDFFYENAVAAAEISMDIDVKCGMTICGTMGEIYVPEDWWRVGYFKVRQKGEERSKHYSSNFEGNGFRYLIQAILREAKAEGSENVSLTDAEAASILDVLNEVEAGQ